jgi:hypothetical protein
MEDQRFKKDVKTGRESRAAQDASRASAEAHLASSAERRKMFRSEFTQEALPNPPEMPGWHLCWLSTTNQYDPIHKRMRLGYQPVMADELPGFEHLKVKAGEHVGHISCNEMILYKLPEDIYQDYMLETHHYAPLEEAEKIRVQQEQLLAAKDSSGKSLIRQEGDGIPNENGVKTPIFE